MTRVLDERFGIVLTEGEEVIFAAEPNDRFVWYHVIQAVVSIVGIPFSPLIGLGALIAKDKYRYWLTNRRVILSSGFLGYTVRSIPLERISDVGLSNTFVEILSGVKSVIVRDMTGEAQSGKWLLAVDNAPELQAQILEQVQRVNRKSTVV